MHRNSWPGDFRLPEVSFGDRSLACAALWGISALISSAASAAEPGKLSDALIVVAERRATSLIEAPLSVTRIDEAELQLLGADHASEIVNRAPGVLVHRGSGQESLTSIRSPVLTGGAGAGSFLYLQDGVPLRAAGFANVNGLLEAHTEIATAVEVIRGPSGAVYGANAIHGVIDVRTGGEGPRASAVTLSGDTIGRLKAVGVVDLSDVSEGAFVGLWLLDDPGFRADSGVDEQKLTVRHVARGDRWNATTTFSGVNVNQETAGFIEGADAYRDADLRRTNPNPEAFRDVQSARLSTRLDIELDDDATLSITPFVRWTDMDFLLHFLPSKALEENEHWSLGVQTAVYVDRGDWSVIAGVDVDRSDGSLTEFQSIPTVFSFTQGLHYDYGVVALEVAPFGQLEWRPSPQLTLRAAARVDRTGYRYDNRTDVGVVGRFLRPADRRDVYTTVSPKFSAAYALSDGLNLYASYARGARPPQTTDLYRLQVNQTSDPPLAETIDAGEVGARGALSADIDFEVAAYLMDKRNVFFRDADGFNVSDGRTRHAGVEARVIARPFDGIRIDANVAYGRHTYRFDRAIGGGGGPLAPSEAIAFGDDIDTAPRILAGARGVWSPDFAPVVVEASWNRVGGYFTDAGETRRYPGHDVVDLRADYRIAGGLSAFVAIRNLGNVFYAERADFAFGADRYFPGEGRVATFGIRVAAPPI